MKKILKEDKFFDFIDSQINPYYKKKKKREQKARDIKDTKKVIKTGNF